VETRHQQNQEYLFYVGIDWATEQHQCCVLNSAGKIVGKRNVEHSGSGLSALLSWVGTLTGAEPSQVAVAIETPRGPVVETCLEHKHPVFALNPKQLDRFRDRHSVAGAKDDDRDAFVLADSLRTDQPCFQRVQPDGPKILRLRELSRMEADFTENLQRAVNQLYQLLLRYYPQILQLSNNPDETWLWALLKIAPTPQLGAKLSPARLQKLLKAHGIRRWKAEQVRDILAAPAFPLTPGSQEAISERVLLLLPQLHVLQLQSKQVAKRLQTLLDAMLIPDPNQPESTEHRDVAVLLSSPGVGRIIAATMLAEASQPLAKRDYHALRVYGGVAPVTRKSGKTKQVLIRYSCNQRVRNALYHWARVATQQEDRAKSHYARLRHEGHSHGRALRGVGDRLLAMLIAMLKKGTLYDASLRSRQGTGDQAD
jgi:endonuclease III